MQVEIAEALENPDVATTLEKYVLAQLTSTTK